MPLVPPAPTVPDPQARATAQAEVTLATQADAAEANLAAHAAAADVMEAVAAQAAIAGSDGTVRGRARLAPGL